MRRAALVVFGVIVAVPVVAVLGAGTLLDSSAVRSRMAAALERATGHAARLDGPVRLSWSLEPGVTVEDAALLNPPGFSRPVFAGVRRLTARLRLLPLLSGRVELRDVALDGADVLLERDAAGRGNWLRAEAAPGTAPSSSAGAGPRLDVTVRSLAVTNSQVAWRGGPVIAVREVRFALAGGPLEGTVLVNGVPLVLGGSTGLVPGGGTALDLTAAAPGLSAAVSGTLGGAGTSAVAVQVRAAELSAFSPLVGRELPPLRGVQMSFTLPGPAALRLTAEASPLERVMPGLAVQQLRVEADGRAEPVRGAAVLTLRQLPVALAVNVASLDALLAGGAVPVQAKAEADGGTVGGQGTLDWAGRTAEMTVSARVPDLARAGALAGQSWPGLRDLALDARVLPRPGAPGILLRGLRVSAQGGDLAGDLALGTEPRPSLRGSLVSQRIDLDAVMAAAAPPPAASAPAAQVPTSPLTSPPASASPPNEAARPLPFAALRAGDIDLRLAVAQLTYGGVPFRAAEGRVLLQDGRLRIDPARVSAPGGPVQVQVLADATASPPTAALSLRAPALDAAPLAAALGANGAASGALELDLQAKAIGADWPAMARTLDGHLAAAMVEGEIENAALLRLFGPALRAARLPTDGAGRSHVRCLAVRADAASGQVTLHTVALDATKLRLDGEGNLNLVDETMDLHLRPTIRIGGANVAVPVHLTGPLRAPVPAVDRGVIAPGRFGLSIGGAAPDPCPAALAAVRAR